MGWVLGLVPLDFRRAAGVFPQTAFLRGFSQFAPAALLDFHGGADVPAGHFEVAGHVHRGASSHSQLPEPGRGFEGAVEAFDPGSQGVLFFPFPGFFLRSSRGEFDARAGSGFASGGGDEFDVFFRRLPDVGLAPV